MVTDAAGRSRYTVISADCHGGGVLATTAATSSSVTGRVRRVGGHLRDPVRGSEGRRRRAQLGPERRLHELEADGVVAEVIFPNTIPPFFPEASLDRSSRRPPTRATSSCAGPGSRRTTAGWPTSARDAPGRRAGIAQILLHDVDAAVGRDPLGQGGRAHRRHPAARRAAGLGPARRCTRRDYEPIWAVCEELDMPINHHGGSAAPDYGRRIPRRRSIFLLEVDVVLAPRAVAPDLRRRARAPSRTCSSCSPSRAPAGSPSSWPRSTTSSSRMARRRRFAGAGVGRAGRWSGCR